MALHGVILDVDGTLIDSNDAHAQSWQRALEESGFHLPYDRIRRLIGMGGDKLLPALTHLSESSELGNKISGRRGEIFRSAFLPELKPFPRAKELLQQLVAYGLKLVVASSASRQDLKALLNLIQAGWVIDEEVSKDDARSSKPDPDTIQVALRKLGYPPTEVLMLGDTPYDIEAASRAEIKTVAVECGGWDRQALAGAIAVYQDPADLLLKLDTSPFNPEAQLPDAEAS